jgi:hypothetical protein
MVDFAISESHFGLILEVLFLKNAEVEEGIVYIYFMLSYFHPTL